MGIIVDLIIIVVVLLFIFLGYKKGLTGSLIKLLSFIIAIVVAFVLYKPVANAVIENTVIDDNIRTMKYWEKTATVTQEIWALLLMIFLILPN